MAINFSNSKERFVIDSFGKYFSNERLSNIFIENKIRFTPPNDFNDPLEFKPIIKGIGVHDGYTFEGKHYPSMAEFITKGIMCYYSENYGVLSLTKVPDSFHMWSLYANGHKGFFIVFKNNFNSQKSFVDEKLMPYPISKITYTEDYYLEIQVKYIDQTFVDKFAELNREIMFFTKLNRWINEEEYRIVRPLKYLEDKREKSLFEFDINYISDIVFGASMNINDKIKIKKQCDNKKIDFYQSMIFKDEKDSDNKLGRVHIWKIPQDIPWDNLVVMDEQRFLSDLEKSKGKKKVISSLKELPYPAERVILYQ